MEDLLKEEEKEEEPTGNVIEWKKKKFREELEREVREDSKAGGQWKAAMGTVIVA